MAATTITLTPEYGYVVLTATSTFFLGFWHGLRCGPFRKAAGVSYPTPYADSAMLSTASSESADKKHALYLWNCAQRAHGNYNESQPSVVAALLIAGLKYPIAASVLGAAWCVARVVYAVGYTSSTKTNGSGRLMGAPMWLFQLGLFGLSAFVGYTIAFPARIRSGSLI